jgi:hypothetical protein
MNEDNQPDKSNLVDVDGHPQAPPNPSLLLISDDEGQPPVTTSNVNQSLPTALRRVDHTYRDYSNFPLEELPIRKRAPTNFPSKLHQILSNPEYSHVSQMPCHSSSYS